MSKPSAELKYNWNSSALKMDQKILLGGMRIFYIFASLKKKGML